MYDCYVVRQTKIFPRCAPNFKFFNLLMPYTYYSNFMQVVSPTIVKLCCLFWKEVITNVLINE